MGELKKLATYMKPYLKYYLVIFPGVLLVTGLVLPIPMIIKYLIDKVIPGRDIAALNVIILCIVGLYIVRTVIRFFINYAYAFIGNRINIDIREKVFTHIQSLPFSYLNKQSTGALVSRVMNDVGSLNGILTSSIFIDNISNLFSLVVVLVILVNLDWKLTLLNLICLPVYWFVNKKFNAKVRETSKATQEQSARTVGGLTESIENQKIIRAFNGEGFFVNSFVSQLENLVRLYLRGIKFDSLVQQLSAVIGVVGPLLVLWYGSVLIFNEDMTVGGLFAFYQYLLQVYTPINSFMGFNMQIQTAWGAVSRINEFLEIETEKVDEGINIQKLSGKITFNKVNFSYASKKPVLQDVSFKIAPGEFIGVVGPSGSGKTTLGNILMKFYPLDSGEVFFDDYSIEKIKPRDLRRHIGVVTQESYLFRTTIEENIRLGNPDADDEEVRSAAKLAQIHEFIMSLPDKYKTIVGEKGVNLSGGQKQRISLARAFLKKPEILIFDEATSALDSNLEKLIQTTLEDEMNDATCIVIAHRLSTIINADKIIVLDKGRIVEEGKHAELVRRKGLYYQLYMQQFGTQEDETDRGECVEERLA